MENHLKPEEKRVNNVMNRNTESRLSRQKHEAFHGHVE